MKLRISKETIINQDVPHTRWLVKDENGVTRASTRTRDEVRKFVKNHKEELRATQS